MTQEDKDLLLIDLCARMPYGVKCKYYDCCEDDYDEGTICGFERKEYIQIDGVCIHIEEVKPYLFPMDSMTDEQQIKFQQYLIAQSNVDVICSIQGYDWLNANYFDYRGLIDKGLAIDATNLGIYELRRRNKTSSK